ncbi:GntR family transcriptional regulator [Arthrobacter sp. CAN_A1]|uniref:GntR family transcriptional regulator n=1 Tax=Arthrobacter sp. CAN_A1 TaxID=2787717 RepID=UPI0018C8DD21
MIDDADTDSGRPTTAPAFVLAKLRRAIIAGELVPGQPLRQDALAERFGVSRVPLREAFKVLEGEGQVVYAPHRGYKVATLSLTDLLEVYRIREILEAEAVRVAIRRSGEDVVGKLRAAAQEVEAASASGDLLTMTEANRRFHFLMVAEARMPRLEKLIQVLWDATETYRFVYYGDEVNRHRVEDEHRRIIDAFASRDTDQVITLINEHRNHAVDALRTFLDVT